MGSGTVILTEPTEEDFKAKLTLPKLHGSFHQIIQFQFGNGGMMLHAPEALLLPTEVINSCLHRQLAPRSSPLAGKPCEAALLALPSKCTLARSKDFAMTASSVWDSCSPDRTASGALPLPSSRVGEDPAGNRGKRMKKNRAEAKRGRRTDCQKEKKEKEEKDIKETWKQQTVAAYPEIHVLSHSEKCITLTTGGVEEEMSSFHEKAIAVIYSQIASRYPIVWTRRPQTVGLRVLREIIRHTALGPGKSGFTAAASLVSLAWALASYQKALRDSRDDKKPISYMAVVIQFCWHFFTIAARVITFALFASVFQLYFGIFIVLHWCIMTFWIVHCETEFCITKWEEIVFDMVVGIIYIFSWFNVKEGRTRCRLFIYYFVILLENTALSALWYLYKAPQIADAFAIPALCVVFSSFLTGVVFMLMYYAFFHPNGPRFGQSPSCACEDPVAAFTLPPEVATSTLRSISNNRSVTSDRDQKFAERDGCVPVFQVRPTAPSTPSSRPPRIEESVIKIDLFRNRYPAWERHVLDRSLRKAILAFECSPSPPRLQYKDDALIQERLEYETTL
ncbi:hypothetical protein PANDA_013432 [Ailuropoda melanoleuca]|uniref:XK-related protein n=1 Tax=Ailuropoda melanoleuca TaxID=9646 RepID=D2HNX4_AILME|nr:hypothetical protein PANDA_013432 [Ailuropoda melanoleuca]